MLQQNLWCNCMFQWASLGIIKIKFILVSEMKGTKQTEWHFDSQMNNLLFLCKFASASRTSMNFNDSKLA